MSSLNVIGRDLFPNLVLDKEAFSCYKKPKVEDFRIALTDQTVVSLEGIQDVKKGDFIMHVNNTNGEWEWPIKPNIFKESRVVVKDWDPKQPTKYGRAYKIKIKVYCKQMQHDIYFKTQWSDDILTQTAGCYLVQYEAAKKTNGVIHGNYAAVEKNVWQQTYALWDDHHSLK